MVANHCTMRRTHIAHVAPCVKWRQLVVPCPELTMDISRATSKMATTRCTMPRTHIAQVAPCAKWGQLIVPCPELTMHMWHHVENGGNSMNHAQNSLCGYICKMTSTRCTTPRTHYAHVAPCVKWQQLVAPCPKLTTHMWCYV